MEIRTQTEQKYMSDPLIVSNSSPLIALEQIGLGILMASKRKGFIHSIQPCLQSLTNHGFRISTRLYELVLSNAGE